MSRCANCAHALRKLKIVWTQTRRENKMIYIDLNLNTLCYSDNHIGYIYPNVKIGMDCSDNVDV